MKFPKLCAFLGLMIVLMACSGQKINSTPKIFATLTPSSQPTITIQPTLTSTSIPTMTFTATPDACSKQTIPTDTIFSESTRVSQDKFIALGEGNLDKGGEVFLTNMDGDVIKNVTNHPADDVSPEWSPNGEKIAFLSNRNGKIPNWCLGPSDDCMYQLFSINPDGTELSQITKDWTFQYSWSPDSKQVAFVRAVKSGESPDPDNPFLYEIYSVNSDGTNLHNLTNYPGIYFDFIQPIWSPNGKKIAFLSGDIAFYPNSINIVNNDGTGLVAYSDIKASEIVWNMDSDSLLFVSRPDSFLNSNIYKLQTDFTNVKQITFTQNTNKEFITLSPNGNWLAYHSKTFDSAAKTILCDQIRVINVETLQDYFVYDAQDVGNAILERRTASPSYDPWSIRSIQWMPDGKRLLFNQMVHYGVILGIFDESFSIQLDGTGLRQFGERSGWHSIQP